MASREKDLRTDPKGIPITGMYPQNVRIFALFNAFNIVLALIGLFLAWFLVYSPLLFFDVTRRTKVDAKIQYIADNDLGWLYLGLIIVKMTQVIPASILANTRKASKTHVPDQHVYEVKGVEGKKLGYVLMATDGVQGTFNRAQRGFNGYLENLPTFIFMYVAASYVFPFGSFLCCVIWVVARIMAMHGYTQSTEGRMTGGTLSHFPVNIMQGMMIIIAFKSFLS